MELGHLPYKDGESEDYIGKRGLDRVGKKKWRKYVNDASRARLSIALLPDYVVLGGGERPQRKELLALPGGDNLQRLPRRFPPLGRRRRPGREQPAGRDRQVNADLALVGHFCRK